MRALVDRFKRAHPGAVKGIVGRGESLVAAQLGALERLSTVDLDGRPDAAARRHALETLLRAQHLPNILVAMSRVLEEQEKDRALEAIADDARLLGEKLAILTQAWVLRHGADLEGDEEDELPEWV